MDFDLQAGDGAYVQVGDAHGGELAIDGFDSQAEGAQAAALGERVGGHVVLVQWDEHAAARGTDDGLVGGTVVALIPVDPEAVGQLDGEFVDRGEVVEGARQEGEGHRQPICRADEMQAPAEELESVKYCV